MKNTTFKIWLLFVLGSFKMAAQTTPDMLNTIFPTGDKIQGGNFTGTVWVSPLLPADSTLNASISNVVFEPYLVFTKANRSSLPIFLYLTSYSNFSDFPSPL